MTTEGYQIIEPICGEREKLADGDGLGCMCTEPPGHEGDHVAEDDQGREVSRWSP